MTQILRPIARWFGLIRYTVREIFDENAYARFLARNRLAASRASYAAFIAENESARSPRPRCC